MIQTNVKKALRRALFALATIPFCGFAAEGGAGAFHTQRFPSQGLGYSSQFDAEEMASRLEEIYVNDKTISNHAIKIEEEFTGRRMGNLYVSGGDIRYRVVGQYFKA